MAETWRLVAVDPSEAQAGAMALLWAQAEAHRNGLAVPQAITTEAVTAEAKRLARPRVVAVMAFAGRTPVAGCHGEPALRSDGSPSMTGAHLSGVSVHPDWWGQGIGGGMLRFVAEQLREHDFEDAQLWVLETNVRARRLYEQAGWKLVRLGAFHRDGPHAVYHLALAPELR